MGRCVGTATLILLLASPSLAEEYPAGKGFGCQQKLSAVCPGWESDKATCLKCVSVSTIRPVACNFGAFF